MPGNNSGLNCPADLGNSAEPEWVGRLGGKGFWVGDYGCVCVYYLSTYYKAVRGVPAGRPFGARRSSLRPPFWRTPIKPHKGLR